ncbi:CHASE domain-containing protein [Candidatus Saccharibacteria bacterium]|nr:CHASE domain-containing protein [Candidatus Saccharibacteria bacterium]
MIKLRFDRWKTNHLTSYDLLSIHLIPTVIVFLTLMIIIGLSWRTAVRDVQKSQSETVFQRSIFVETTVKQRLNQYDNILRAGVGIFNGSFSVSRDEWRRFIGSLEINERFPGLLGVGFIEFISPSDLDGYENRIRNEGFSNFNISPREPTRDLYSSITYIEPFNSLNQPTLGYDLYSDPVRRAAMEKARDSGRVSLTDLVQLLQDKDNDLKHGFVLFHPVYKINMPLDSIEQRRAAIIGYIYTPFRAEELFGTIFDSNDPNFSFEIYDSTSDKNEFRLFSQNSSDVAENHKLVTRNEVTLFDQLWMFQYSAKDTIVPRTLRERPASVAYGGTIFSLIVAAGVYFLLQKRTKALSHKEERKLQRAKDDMLSLASHQLRTPATGVKQYVGMLLEGFVGEMNDEQRDILSRAYESNERQLRIINEFLYMAKADADRIVVSLQTFDLAELTRDILDGMRTEIADAGHSLKFIFPKTRILVKADPHSARMIIENLISNAIKYTPARGKITVKLKKMAYKCLLSVTDNGVGIERSEQKRLFRQFSRIPNELTKQTTGSGIGLYLAQYLARLNGGEITVISIPNKGSTFTAIFNRKNVRKVTENTKN